MRLTVTAVAALCAAATGCGEKPTTGVPTDPVDASAAFSPDARTPPPPPRPFELPALQGSVDEYALEMPQSTLDAFRADPYLAPQAATFTHDGVRREVLVRVRGGSSRAFAKKSWRVEFPVGEKFDGRRKLNLIAEYQDATMMVEKLAFDLLLGMGAPAPRGKFVRLRINGRYEGVYLDLERVDKNFVEAHGFLDTDATIYRCLDQDCEMKMFLQPYPSYQRTGFEKKTNETEPRDDLDAFLRTVNRTPEPHLVDVLENQMELELYLRSMAMDALMSNAIVEDSASYLVRDRITGRWTYVPWDLNNSDARWWPTYGLGMKPIVEHPMFCFSLTDSWIEDVYARRVTQLSGYLPAFSNLSTRVAFNPELRERVLRLIEKAMAELFKPEVLEPRIDAMFALIDDSMRSDPYIEYPKFAAGPAFLKAYVVQRAAFLESEIARYRGRELGVVLEAFDPRGGWVELANRGAAPASIGGLVVTTNLRRAMSRNVPARTLQPGEKVRLTAGALGLSFPAEGELGLFDGASVVGALDVLFYGAPPAGLHYARDAAAPETWRLR